MRPLIRRSVALAAKPRLPITQRLSRIIDRSAAAAMVAVAVAAATVAVAAAATVAATVAAATVAYAPAQIN